MPAMVSNKARAVIGDKFESVKNLSLYVKPEEGKVYFVADEETGSFDL